MSWFKRVFDDYFDDGSTDSSNNNSNDSDIYDESNEIGNPSSPVWDGSEVHTNPYGPDPTMPDSNDVNSD